MLRRLALTLVLVVLGATGTASAASKPRPSFASEQSAAVVDAGLMAPSIAAFRPEDPLTETEFAVVLASLGVPVAVTDPDRAVTVRELDARLVSFVGLRPAAMQIRLAGLNSGLAPRPWVGTETIARMLGLRINHERETEALELQLSQPATRAEAAYSIARVLALTDEEVESVRETAATFAVPYLTDLQRAVISRALGFVGSPYVWAGTSEHPQKLAGTLQPGGFDCSGFVWRVYKLETYAGAPPQGASARRRRLLRGPGRAVVAGAGRAHGHLRRKRLVRPLVPVRNHAHAAEGLVRDAVRMGPPPARRSRARVLTRPDASDYRAGGVSSPTSSGKLPDGVEL